jgi:protein-export membrane protein SecD
MRRAGTLLGLIFCALAVPAAARGVHMVLKVDVPAAETGRRDEIVNACMEVVSRRLGKLGIKWANFSGDITHARIEADLSNVSDLGKLRAMFGPEKDSLSFLLVDEDVKDEDIRAGRVPDGVEVLKPRGDRFDRHPPPLAVYRGDVVSGERIVDARAVRDERTAEPSVEFKFDDLGRKQFAEFTQDNVGKRFAIVLDGEIVSAPRIMSQIAGGSGVIEGDLDDKEANALAAALQAGLTPVPMTIVELKETGNR